MSFSLVTGSVCLVKFANKVGKNDNGSKVAVTLNISSSGAKNLGIGGFNTESTISHMKNMYDDYYYLNTNILYLVLYNGAHYTVASGDVSRFIYSDSTSD